MEKPVYDIRVATREEIEIPVAWAAQEGWNPGLGDADAYVAADPHGFLIGYLGDEPIATLSVVRYDAGFGFLGFYIVKPEYRGQGYGIRIWNQGLKYLDGCVVGLDGVVDQQSNYAKSGFGLAFRNVRYEGAGTGAADPGAGILSLADLPFETVNGYDRPFFPADRSRFLRSWLTRPGSVACGCVESGALVGYGVVRPCRTGYKIGPLFADTPDLAERLFLALVATVPQNEPFYLDVPEINAEAVALAGRHGMSVVFETARMYSGAAPDLPVERIFGITSFEVG